MKVTITPIVPGGRKPLTVLMGSSPPVVSAEGGWLVVNRPKKVGFTAWEGYAPRTMSLRIMFDGFSDEVSQEERYSDLHRMMRDPVGPARQPSPVTVRGAGVPFGELRWVIQSIEPDTASVLRDEVHGDLRRIEVTVSLLEYIEADVLVSKTATSPANRIAAGIGGAAGGSAGGGTAGSGVMGGLASSQLASSSTQGTTAGGGWTGGAWWRSSPTTSGGGGTHTVKIGDTLWSIAQKHLGAGKRYTEIAELNGIRNPNSVPVGTVLKLP